MGGGVPTLQAVTIILSCRFDCKERWSLLLQYAQTSHFELNINERKHVRHAEFKSAWAYFRR
jgi:hypothetical protein